MADLVACPPGLRRLIHTRDHLAVLGSPIAHSKSPLLHRAAYQQLGLAWHYEAIDVKSEDLASFVASRGDYWRGLSLTMPLKRAVLPLLKSVDDTALQSGAVNTVLFDDASHAVVLRGFNTDVYGIVAAFRARGVDHLSRVQLLGSGATATSALLAVSRLGAEQVVVSARTPSHADSLRRLADELGLRVEVRPLDADHSGFVADAVISTIPGGVASGPSFAAETLQSSVLFEVAYDAWPTPLATLWMSAGGRVISGVEMLLHQALAQVRIFVGGDPGILLTNEAAVLEAMRGSISPV
ncbi:MAG: shikimate dehydrogenase [Lacisediminihabitans sp.]